jgi:hypothetical protein
VMMFYEDYVQLNPMYLSLGGEIDFKTKLRKTLKGGNLTLRVLTFNFWNVTLYEENLKSRNI